MDHDAFKLQSYAKHVSKKYLLLTKPGIILGNVLTTAAGFRMASKMAFDSALFFWVIVGLSLVIASACVWNNYIDREADKKMARTQERAFAKGTVRHKNGLIFASCLGVLGALCLGLFANLFSMLIALFGFFMYVTVYSFSKYRTVHATLLGSIAGAVPPMVGYAAVSDKLDLPAFILFAMLVLWQMPHFFAIAIYRLPEYTKAAIPVMPLKRGVLRTKVQMFLYIAAFMAVSCLLTFFHYAGYAYLVVVLLLSLLWLHVGFTGFQSTNDKLWARKSFLWSLVVITGVSLALIFKF